LQMAFGVLRLTPDVFWRMTWKEYDSTLRGFFEHERNKNEQALLNAKYISYHSVLPWMGKHKKISFEQFAGMTKSKNGGEALTDEQVQEMVKKMGRYIDKNGNYTN